MKLIHQPSCTAPVRLAEYGLKPKRQLRKMILPHSPASSSFAGQFFPRISCRSSRLPKKPFNDVDPECKRLKKHVHDILTKNLFVTQAHVRMNLMPTCRACVLGREEVGSNMVPVVLAVCQPASIFSLLLDARAECHVFSCVAERNWKLATTP